MRRAIRTLVAAVVFLSSLIVGRGADAKTTDQSFVKEKKKPLILQHANELFAKKNGIFDTAWHYSHSSHMSHSSHWSHSSHMSHSSHYSHYSSW